MNISYRSLILLYCINQIKCERSIFGIYHILTGKKSSQTITDGNLYQLSHLFSMMKGISRSELLDCVHQLLTSELIISEAPDKYCPTEKGIQYLCESLSNRPIPSSINGWRYYDVGFLFWQRLSLLIQVLSNLIKNQRQYITIQQDQHVLSWTKDFLFSKKGDKHHFSNQLYNECRTCLDQVSELEATVFVLKLTSADRIGYTSKQIASIVSEDEYYIDLLFINVLHFILKMTKKDSKSFPILTEISSGLSRTWSLTDSATKTYKFILEGKTIEEIASLRRLKHNTIEDHIVEIAHNVEGFNIAPFVSKVKQQQILKAQNSLQTLKLKQIKDSIELPISYFEIRLVLAKSGVENELGGPVI